jgi:hypothetical protein
METLRKYDWSNCVGDGWKGLVVSLVAACEANNAQILQVKEKFGGLRFYAMGGPDWLDDLIGIAELASYMTCEDCGVTALIREVSTQGSWLKTLCIECREKHNAPKLEG